MTTQAITRIEVIHNEGVTPPSVAAQLALESSKPREEAVALSNFFAGLASGRSARVRVAVDSVAEAAAAITLAVTQANIAVGEYLDIAIPNVGSYRITAVASGADVSLGQFVSQTSNAVTATNMAAAVNGMIGLKDWVIATTNSGNLILTAKREGNSGNEYKSIDGTVNGLSPAGGLFTGGKDAGARVTSSAALTHANIAADDTITIAGVVFTWKASASSESEVTIGANATADGDNLAAKVNAHSKLLGILTAANVSGTVTFTYEVPARIAILLLLATSDGNSATLTQPSSTLTLANQQATRSYGIGAP